MAPAAACDEDDEVGGNGLFWRTLASLALYIAEDEVADDKVVDDDKAEDPDAEDAGTVGEDDAVRLAAETDDDANSDRCVEIEGTAGERIEMGSGSEI